MGRFDGIPNPNEGAVEAAAASETARATAVDLLAEALERVRDVPEEMVRDFAAKATEFELEGDIRSGATEWFNNGRYRRSYEVQLGRRRISSGFIAWECAWSLVRTYDVWNPRPCFWALPDGRLATGGNGRSQTQTSGNIFIGWRETEFAHSTYTYSHALIRRCGRCC